MPQRRVQPSPAGWYDDPYEAGKLRYFDGAQWTNQVELGDRRTLASNHLAAAEAGDLDLPIAPSMPRPLWCRLVYASVGVLAVIGLVNVAIRIPHVGLLLAALFQLAVTAVLAPRVSYRRLDAFAMLIPLWNIYLLCRIAWRLAYLPFRDWEPRPDEANGWQRWRHPTRPHETLYLPTVCQPATSARS